jgi:hypothetical protein
MCKRIFSLLDENNIEKKNQTISFELKLQYLKKYLTITNILDKKKKQQLLLVRIRCNIMIGLQLTKALLNNNSRRKQSIFNPKTNN